MTAAHPRPLVLLAAGASKPVAARGGVAKPKLDAGKKAAKSKGPSETQAPAANKPGSIQVTQPGMLFAQFAA